METGKKISVIVPMYNAERYIGKCLESVVRQTYPELEILVIDDGSVDKGPGICGKLAERDGRIQVLRQENQGVSAARNTGLDRACGEYVFFLDSDDAIHPRLLEEMLGRAEGWGAQLAFCGYARMDGRELEESLKRDWGEDARKGGGQAGGKDGWSLRDDSVVKSTCCCSIGPTFGSQNPYSSQPPIVQLQGSNIILWPSWTPSTQTYIQAKHLYTEKIIKVEREKRLSKVVI